DPAGRLEPFEAFREQDALAEPHERLWPVRAEPLAATRSDEDRPDRQPGPGELGDAGGCLGLALAVRRADEDVVEPRCGLVLVHLLRVHELAGADLLR